MRAGFGFRKEDEDSLNAKNMKRESKVYSYKEQLEELQLRRELEERKRKQGKLKEPVLTSKQKELMRLQLEKESGIRARLTKVCGAQPAKCHLPDWTISCVV